MKKLLSLFIFSLLFISLQSIAGRPAEDDPSLAMEPMTTDTSSNIPMPEQDMETISEEQPAETTVNESQQSGDIIKLEETTPAHIVIIDFPVRGMDMSKVINELGEPTTRFPAVGKPPITRWVYPDRTVFFEYSHVIHVVAR
ncbi:MAG: hypothetical protein KAU21_01855 [Gammaproteobacteria bacterium]|nr:hypothetical protein [Gammaproteobacteria bacterium]